MFNNVLDKDLKGRKIKYNQLETIIEQPDSLDNDINLKKEDSKDSKNFIINLIANSPDLNLPFNKKEKETSNLTKNQNIIFDKNKSEDNLNDKAIITLDKNDKNHKKQVKKESASVKLPSLTVKYQNYLCKSYINKLNIASVLKTIYNFNVSYMQKYKKYKVFLKIKEIISSKKKLQQDNINLIISRLTNNNLNNKHLRIEDPNLELNHLFKYKDLKEMLINKCKNSLSLDSNTNQNNFYLKLKVFTTKDYFVNMNILQNIFKYSDQSIEIEEGSYFIILKDSNYEGIVSTYFYFEFIFLDKIYDISAYISDNQCTLNKFGFGLVYLDYNDNNLIAKLLMVLEYSVECFEKDVVFLVNNSNNEIDKDIDIKTIEQINQIQLKYKFPNNKIYYVYNYNEFPENFKLAVQKYNNKEIYELFNENLYLNYLKPLKFVKLVDLFTEYIKIYKLSYWEETNLLNEHVQINSKKWAQYFQEVIFLLN